MTDPRFIVDHVLFVVSDLDASRAPDSNKYT